MLMFYKVGHVQRENTSIQLMVPGQFLDVNDYFSLLPTVIQQVFSECCQSQVSSLYQSLYSIKKGSIKYDKAGAKHKEENNMIAW